jgi:hypothetical protein
LRRVLHVLALLALVTPSLAQEPVVYGVELTVNEATGTVTCSQSVMTADYSLVLDLSSEEGVLMVVLAFENTGASIYDGYALEDQDRVYFDVGGHVSVFPVIAADLDYDYSVEYVAVFPPREFFTELLSSPWDVPVRFESDYSGLQMDVTLQRGMLAGLAQGFAVQCM